MNAHDILDDDALEKASLYALTALPADAARAYEAHLHLCSACRNEVASLKDAAAGLTLLAPAVMPPPDLRGKVLSRFRAAHASAPPPPSTPPSNVPASPNVADAKAAVTRPWQHWDADRPQGEMFYAFNQEGAWQHTDFEGIDIRRLFVDQENDRVSMLVRMAPGTAYPPHRHGNAEECYVIAGDLRVGDTVMHAGDYQCARGGSAHPVQSTEAGCLLFIVSSMHDELLA